MISVKGASSWPVGWTDYAILPLPSQRVAGDLLRSVHILEALRDMFEYKDEKGKDQVCAQ